MTQEEKARAYDEALERAKAYHRNELAGSRKEMTEYIFPELRESKDERIRSCIGLALTDVNEQRFKDFGITLKDCLSWLEKQKEQKPVDYDHEMWKNCEANFEGGKKEVIDHPEKYGLQKEQKPNIELIQRAWYMEGYHDREFGKEPMWIIKTEEGGPKHELNPKYGQPLADEQKPAEWSVDEKIRKRLISHFRWLKENVLVDGEWRCFKIDDIIAFLERYKEQKPEWSEEDETIIEGACNALEIHGHNKLASKLKSLRPQPQGTYKLIIHNIYEMLKDKDFFDITPSHRVSLLNDIRVRCKNADEQAEILDVPSWKPSKEQMKALKNASAIMKCDSDDAAFPSLKTLYE